jgi:hypothetical protein
MTDLAPDIVELAPWVPLTEANSPLREVRFNARAWLPEERETLRTMFEAGQPVETIADKLGRGLAGVKDKMWQLGLRRKSTLPWTELETDELVRRYGRESAATIAQDLGRTVRAGYERGIRPAAIAELIGRSLGATMTKACDLGIRHPDTPPNWSEAEITRALQLANLGRPYGEVSEQLQREGFPRRTKGAFGLAIRKLGYARGWGRPWTPEEDDLLRLAYSDGASLTPLITRLGRSRSAIAGHAKELGLQGSHAIKAGWFTEPAWTEEDEARLRAGYGKTPTKRLASELGRELRAVYCRANHLGLKHPWMRAFTDEDAKLVQIAWARGVALQDLADAMCRDRAVVSKFAIRQGFRFSDLDRPAPPKRGGPKKTRRLSRAGILALAEPGDVFAPLRQKPRGRASPRWGASNVRGRRGESRITVYWLTEAGAAKARELATAQGATAP